MLTREIQGAQRAGVVYLIPSGEVIKAGQAYDFAVELGRDHSLPDLIRYMEVKPVPASTYLACLLLNQMRTCTQRSKSYSLILYI